MQTAMNLWLSRSAQNFFSDRASVGLSRSWTGHVPATLKMANVTFRNVKNIQHFQSVFPDAEGTNMRTLSPFNRGRRKLQKVSLICFHLLRSCYRRNAFSVTGERGRCWRRLGDGTEADECIGVACRRRTAFGQSFKGHCERHVYKCHFCPKQLVFFFSIISMQAYFSCIVFHESFKQPKFHPSYHGYIQEKKFLYKWNFALKWPPTEIDQRQQLPLIKMYAV